MTVIRFRKKWTVKEYDYPDNVYNAPEEAEEFLSSMGYAKVDLGKYRCGSLLAFVTRLKGVPYRYIVHFYPKAEAEEHNKERGKAVRLREDGRAWM